MVYKNKVKLNLFIGIQRISFIAEIPLKNTAVIHNWMAIIQKPNGTNKAFGDISRIVLDTIMQKINQVEE